MSAGTGSAPAYRVDGASASSEHFYAVACDPLRSVAVEACAGAGKTWLLVSRIVRALLAGAEPHEILAITFTRKAAGEMRTRLHEWLLAFAAPGCSHATRVAELRARGLAEAEAERLAPSLGGLREKVLAAGRPVEIRTFHGWFSQLMRVAPMEVLRQLGLQPEMELVEDMADHRPAVMRRFHAAVLADADLADDYRTLVRDRGRSQTRKWLEAAWGKQIEIELADAAGTLVPSVPPAAVHWPEHSALVHPAERVLASTIDEALRAAAASMALQKGATCRKQGDLLAQALDIDDSRARFRHAYAALFTMEGKPRQNIECAGVAEAHELLEDIQRACRQQSAHEEHLRLVRLARVLLQEAAAYKRSRGLADMADLERCALALLRDATLSGWVQERLDARVRHLLVDEFQDTSPLQWHALHAWLSAYAGAGGGPSGQRPPAVFIVGDPKQSIYRFRRAEPKVFEAASRFVREGLEGHLLACDHTRRNAPEVLEVVNAVFDAAARQGEFSGFRPHTTAQGRHPGAAVSMLPREPRPAAEAAALAADDLPWRDSLTQARVEAEERLREPEARRVAGAVRDLVAEGCAPGEIQVLCRKRESLRLVAVALAAARLPFAAPEEYALTDAIEAQDLVAVLDAIASPRHTLSLAQALRSPLFGASDEDLVALAAASARAGWWQTLMTGDVPSAALHRAAPLLRSWRDAARTLPPHDLLDRIVAEGDYAARVAAAVPAERRVAALGAIDALLGVALTLDGARYATPYGFVRALKRRLVRVAAPAQAAAVQLLTVHGAKGLEARAVFVVDADPEPRNAESATLLVDWPVESPHPLCCAFTYSEVFCAPSLEPLRDRELAARRREELNALYVAMTRARERLIFSATEPFRPGDEASWWQRIEGLAQPFAAGAATIEAAPLPHDDRAVITVLPHFEALVPAIRSAPREPPAEPSASEASRLGEAVHRVLQWSAPVIPAGVGVAPADFATLAAAAAREFAVPPAEVQRLAARIRASPACARFFDGADLRWAGNEVTVTDGGELLRIDRLVALGEHSGTVWWVLDYKLQHRPERLQEYRSQLLRYRSAVQQLEPGSPVRCAFITGEGALVEVVVDAPRLEPAPAIGAN